MAAMQVWQLCAKASDAAKMRKSLALFIGFGFCLLIFASLFILPGQLGATSAIGISPCLWLGGSSPTVITVSPCQSASFTSAQADRGAQVFAAHCEVCHGDVGQGLDKWRLTWDDAHQNCSNYKCHGKDYPPGGFYLPNNYAPALIGDNTLDRFKTARDLYTFISSKMPYQEPGVLPADDYWALASFLIRAHGVTPASRLLDASSAASVPVHPIPASTPVNPLGIGMVLSLPAALGILVFRIRRR